MTLQHEVSSWQDGWATAPIYRAGVEWIDGKGKSHVSDGKQPWPKSRYVKYSAQQSVEMVGDEFSAVGIWFGPRSKGLVCLDIDGNLDRFLGDQPSILDGAHIKSPKSDRAKVLFQVPEELWPDVKGYDNSTDTYQVLWDGQMGVCAGEYGAGGHYTFVPGNVPVAPEWLLEEMKEARNKRKKLHTIVPKDFSHWTEEESIQKYKGWLTHLPFEGDWMGEDFDTEKFWIHVGFCLAGAGLGEEGLALWEYYSKRDTRYDQAWESYNPCAERWDDLTVDGGLGPGTLEMVATYHHPDKPWLPISLKDRNEAKEKAEPYVKSDFEELMEAVDAAMKLDNPALIQHTLHRLAQANGYRDASQLAKIHLSNSEFLAGSPEESIGDLLEEDSVFTYCIPELLASPAVTMVYGRGGSGKTSLMLTLARKVARGEDIVMRGQVVPVKKGRVLWLNGDQNRKRLARQFREVGFKKSDDLVVVHDFSMLHQNYFIELMNKHKPALVVIDAITSCMRGCVVNQNSQEYGDYLYWYTKNNGTLWPDAAIVPLHHESREGNARGSTVLEDAVDEMWQVSKPDEKEKVRMGRNRKLTIHKSRDGNEGKVYWVAQQEDFTYQLVDPDDSLGDRGELSTIDSLLVAMRRKPQWMTLEEVMNLTALGSDKVRDVNLRRLVDKGLVERKGLPRDWRFKAVVIPSEQGCPPENCWEQKRDSSRTSGSDPEKPLPTSSNISQHSRHETTIETHESENDPDTVLPTMLERVGRVNPSPSLENSRVSNKTPGDTPYDIFDSTGITDCDSDETLEVVTTPVKPSWKQKQKALDRFLHDIANSGTVDDVIDIEGEVL